MQKWEYLVLLHAWDEEQQQYFWNKDKTDQDKIEDNLNKCGEEGWELVDTRTVSPMAAFYHFKRPVHP